ncbi:MAG: lycopene beta-cyclase [Flavobacteriaceae bacterium]|jgi:lycopene beta-cyclase|tara:strand:- start:10045 stop:11181 length:1137 start_codon:yes stop_codon:yes gene_type:complete
MKYDYIIAGSGCAGLSLLYKILQTPSLQNKSILVIDKDQKKSNDRTWCFWEKNPGPFESIVYAKWNKLEFLSTDFKKELDLESYTYKMIQGIDFYNFVINYAKKFKNVSFVQESINSIDNIDKKAVLKTTKNRYTANYIFNSTNLFNPKINEQNSLLQHFKGWLIKTEKPVFNPEIGRLMDFRVSQENGATFMYVLPTSTTEALVEYTLFSPRVLDKEVYTLELKKYIKEELEIDNYTLIHQESGVIPMSLEKFEQNPKLNVINIGTSGGYTKASSGYTFQFIQKNIIEIINNLVEGNNIIQQTSFKNKYYQWSDRTLIDVLLSNKLTGKDVFTKMFQKVPIEKILAFLGNESSFLEDFKVFTSFPVKPFLTSGIKQL